MSNPTETAEDRIAKRKAADDDLRERLAINYFDGPHEINSGGFDVMSVLFSTPFRYAICLICGAMVKLDDHEERKTGLVERGASKHMEFHRMHGDYDGDLAN